MNSGKPIEEFPPYEPEIEAGEELYNTAFANGKSFADCFDSPAQRENYPYWDGDRDMVVTMERAINECRTANGEKAWGWKKGKIAALSAYMSYESRGQVINTVIPADDAGALAAYESGKEMFYTKRGQLNFSCSDCHMYGAGLNARAGHDVTCVWSRQSLACVPLQVAGDGHLAPPLWWL